MHRLKDSIDRQKYDSLQLPPPQPIYYPMPMPFPMPNYQPDQRRNNRNDFDRDNFIKTIRNDSFYLRNNKIKSK